jgi:hypothetical protein
VTAPVHPITLLGGGVAVTGTTARWWTYFRHAADTDDPVRAGRFAILSVFAMVGGLISVAVGDDVMIADHQPRQHVRISRSSRKVSPAADGMPQRTLCAAPMAEPRMRGLVQSRWRRVMGRDLERSARRA